MRVRPAAHLFNNQDERRTVTRVLFYEPSFRAVESRLPKGDIEAILMSPDGALTLDGQPVDDAEARAEVGWATGALYMGPIQRYMRVLRASSQLRWLQSGGAGFDNPVFVKLVERGVRLTTNDAQAICMAEYVMAGVLDHYQRGPERRAAQSQGQWARPPFREICGTRWLVIGFGAIGQETARRAGAFGARVVGVRRQGADHPLADAVVGADQIPARLPETDVVVLCTPLNKQTAGMVDGDFLAAMKPGSVLVNVGRGALVDEAALLAALDRGTPEHAVLDVFRTEPLPADSPFWTHPRVSLSGHGSGFGSGVARRSEDLFLENLARYLSKRPLLHEAAPADVLGA
jgi:phosphoglycerate dehydrogenase-like enzyme